MKKLLMLVTVLAAICVPAQLVTNAPSTVTNTPSTNAPAKKHTTARVVTMEDVQKGLLVISNRIAYLQAYQKKNSMNYEAECKRLDLQEVAGQITTEQNMRARNQKLVQMTLSDKPIQQEIGALKLQEHDIKQRYGLP